MAYTFDNLFAADPSNPTNVASNASILLYDPADPTKAPVTITDPTGSPIPNPVTVNKNGFGPAMQHATLDRLAWEGGGFSNFITSYEGIKNEAVSARTAAENAVADAEAAAATTVIAAAVNGSGRLILTKANSSTVDAGAVVGPTGAKGEKGDQGLPGVNAVENDAAVAGYISATSSATKSALSKNYTTKSATDALADLQGRTAVTYTTFEERFNASEQARGGRPYSNNYYATASPHSAGTSNTLGEGVLHLVPWIVHTPMTLQELVCEVTVSGDSGARFRMGVYADSGRCYPKTLMVDTGQSTANIAPFYRYAQTLVSLEPGLYWIGGVVQGTTTAQPTMRTVGADWVPPVNNMSLGSGANLGAAVAATPIKAIGYKATGITGALPTTFPESTTGTVSVAATAPRILIKTIATATKLPTAPLNWRGKDHDFFPHSIGYSDQAVYGHASNAAAPTSGQRFLAWTEDGGETIQYGQNFGSLVQSGEYVTWTGRTSAGYVVVTSSDGGTVGSWGSIWFSTSRTGGFTKVQSIKGTNELSISTPKLVNGQSVMFVGEYSVAKPQPEHYLWMTRDGGQTWSNIKTALNVDTAVNSHFHCTEYDTVNGRIWSSQGDNANSKWSYSTDWGVTWTDVPIPTTDPLYQSDSPYQQPTLIIPWGSRMTVGPDRGTFAAGLWTVNNDGTTPRVAWASVVGERAPWAYARQPIARNGGEAVVPLIDRQAGSNTIYFLATNDSGLSWHLVSKIPVSVTGSEGSGVVGPDANGKIMWKSWGQNPEPYGKRLMVADMPKWV